MPALDDRRSNAMAVTDKVFAGSIPEMYDRLMVPLIFEPYAADLAARVAAAAPKDVLETAAGTGVVTRAAAARLPPGVRITVTDLNQPMLDYAMAKQSGDKRITWKQADALALPFDDQSFDVVACEFGVMFFPDKVKGYKEARRVLKPGGRLLFNVWDKISENDFADTITGALSELFPDDPPQFLARTPHGYHDGNRIRAELAEAGFRDVTIEAVGARSKAASPRDPAVAYCEGTPLRNEIEARGAPGLEEATNYAAEAMAKKYGKGGVDGRIRAFVITAAR
jgi:ubiquinone/menaquinone biosynthesis C-methylase UbiE